MAQTGFTPILIYGSTSAGAVPSASDLTTSADGVELALNAKDGKLFYKDDAGVVQLLVEKGSGSGDVVGPASATDNALVRFDTTTGKLIQNSMVTLSDTGEVSGLTALGLTLNDGYTEEVYAVVDAAGVALSPTNGSIQTWTLGASRTPTAGTWAAGQSMTLMINDGTAYTVTWSTLGVVWVGGTAPTLATSGFTVVTLWKVGSTIYGALTGSVA